MPSQTMMSPAAIVSEIKNGFCSFFFTQKSPFDQIDPTIKKVKANPGSPFVQTIMDPSPQYQENRSIGYAKEDLRRFTIYERMVM